MIFAQKCAVNSYFPVDISEHRALEKYIYALSMLKNLLPSANHNHFHRNGIISRSLSFYRLFKDSTKRVI